MTPEQTKAIEQARARQSGQAVVDVTDAQAAAIQSVKARMNPAQRNENGTYGEIPQGYVLNPSTGQYTNVDERARAEVTQKDAVTQGLGQGVSFGAMDEVVGAMYGATGPGSFAENKTFATEAMRAESDAAREAFPKTSVGSEIAGALTVPFGSAKTVKGAIAASGASGAAYGFGTGEGGVKSRLEDAAISGAGSMFFSAGFAPVNKYLSGVLKGAEKQPSIDRLGGLKNALYRRVDASGFKFSPDDTNWLVRQSKAITGADDYVATVDAAADGVAKLLERQDGKELTLSGLDNIRKKMWKAYSQGGIEQVSILKHIENVDKLIASKAGASELMRSAREANSIWAKANMLDVAFNKARLQTSGSGSGGNILNKYRQAVTSIVTNPQKSKWFNNSELAVMEKFVSGEIGENVLRKVGKLSPNGNGLMLTIHALGAAIDPSTLVFAGVGAAAKEAADNGAMRGARELQQMVAGGASNPASIKGNVAVGAAVNSLLP